MAHLDEAEERARIISAFLAFLDEKELGDDGDDHDVAVARSDQSAKDVNSPFRRLVALLSRRQD